MDVNICQSTKAAGYVIIDNFHVFSIFQILSLIFFII